MDPCDYRDDCFGPHPDTQQGAALLCHIVWNILEHFTNQSLNIAFTSAVVFDHLTDVYLVLLY